MRNLVLLYHSGENVPKVVLPVTAKFSECSRKFKEICEKPPKDAVLVELWRSHRGRIRRRSISADSLTPELSEFEKAAVEKAEAEKAAVEKAEAEKAEAEKAEAEKADAEKADAPTSENLLDVPQNKSARKNSKGSNPSQK